MLVHSAYTRATGGWLSRLLDFRGCYADKPGMAVQIKICGINSVESADAALRAGADFAGLVFFPASPRNLRADQAASLAARLRGRTRIVALLVDANDEAIATAIAAAQPDFLQLHGRETPARVAEIRGQFGKPVIKALSIADASDFSDLSAYEGVTDMMLFDAKAPANAARPGGHGAAFDWQLLRGRSFSRPWLLGGGLNADNVARAIETSGAQAVDVSSGVETSPGVKSAEMIANFVIAAKQFAKASA
jgi:phosphoribosylanthranilate isomerase